MKPQTEQLPPQPEEPDYNTLNLNKPSVILLIEYGLNQLVMKNPVRVKDVQIGRTTVITYEEKRDK